MASFLALAVLGLSAAALALPEGPCVHLDHASCNQAFGCISCVDISVGQRVCVKEADALIHNAGASSHLFYTDSKHTSSSGTFSRLPACLCRRVRRPDPGAVQVLSLKLGRRNR